MTKTLKTRILTAFILVIMLLAVPIAVIGYYVVKGDIIERAQKKVRNDLQAARTVYDHDIERMGKFLKIYTPGANAEHVCNIAKFDYLETVAATDMEDCESAIVRKAFAEGVGVGGTRIMGEEELVEKTGEARRIDILPTEHARPGFQKDVLKKVMAKEYALPIEGPEGEVEAVVYAGRIVNRNFDLVDRIRDLVYGEEMYESKPLGTVTIFQNDVRVATNVLNAEGKRAIGTRVSEEVYDKVVGAGKIWLDQAFVVTHWYKTAYEPIRNIEGEVIGILYVGILEKPFRDMARNVLFLFLAVVAGAVVLAIVSAFVLAGNISKPLDNVLRATHSMSDGDLGYQVQTNTGIWEFDNMLDAFNNMSNRLKERDEHLRIANNKLEESNKNYVELISFVSHELKGILASAIINTYSVRDGLLGLVNFKQRKAIDSVARNLDYLDATVKKFLNLGRIEQDRLKINKTDLNMDEDIFEPAVESLVPLAKRKGITIDDQIPQGLSLKADGDMMKIVANNLLSNAIKYGLDDGLIKITADVQDDRVEIDVYNDSVPIGDDQLNRLFKKFSRLENEETRKQKGSGLGLYITSQIIEKHGGSIRVEPREKGNSFIFEIKRGE